MTDRMFCFCGEAAAEGQILRQSEVNPFLLSMIMCFNIYKMQKSCEMMRPL